MQTKLVAVVKFQTKKIRLSIVGVLLFGRTSSNKRFTENLAWLKPILMLFTFSNCMCVCLSVSFTRAFTSKWEKKTFSRKNRQNSKNIKCWLLRRSCRHAMYFWSIIGQDEFRVQRIQIWGTKKEKSISYFVHRSQASRLFFAQFGFEVRKFYDCVFHLLLYTLAVDVGHFCSIYFSEPVAVVPPNLYNDVQTEIMRNSSKFSSDAYT